MKGHEQQPRVGELVASLRAGVSPVCDPVPPGPTDFGVLTLAAVTSNAVDRRHAKRIAAIRVQPHWPTVKAGTILITRGSGSRALVGACVLVQNDEPRLILPDTAWVLEVAEGRSARFLVEFLQSERGRRAIHEITRGSNGIWKISQSAFLGMPLPPSDPHLEGVVSRVSELFDQSNQTFINLVESKCEFKRGVLRALLSGRRRFPSFVKSESRQKGQFGTVPSDWRVVQIGEVAEEIAERGAIEGSIVYSCTKHDGLVPSLEYFGRQVFSRNLDAYKRLQVGDFAYATNHIEEGSIGLLGNGNRPGLVSPMYTVFRTDASVRPEYLYALLKTESYRRVFAARMSASVDRRGSLRWKEFARIKIGLPQLDEQTRIVEVLDLLSWEVTQLRRLDELVRLQKRGLLSELLVGNMAAAAA